MLTKFRLILITLFISSIFTACGNSEVAIEAGTPEQAVTDKYGVPSFTQSRTIDALTFTHSEWTNEAGTTSVQFHNGEVKYSQFTPVTSED